jgi:hypothetical protein
MQAEAYRPVGGLPLLNSWGEGFPHVTWVPFDVLDFLIFKQGGDAAVVVDR